MKKYLLIICILFLSACSFVNVVDEVYITNYLNEKYGSDIEFTPMYTSSCNVFENGTCRASFTSSDTEDKEIHIIWNQNDGSDLRDDYLFLKYDKELKDYYSKLLKNAINYNFNITEISNKSDYLWKESLEFDKFIKYENLNSGIAIDLNAGEIDLNQLGDKIKEYFNSKGVNNVASLYLTTYKSGCDLSHTESCKKINSIYYEVKIVEYYDENAKKS